MGYGFFSFGVILQEAELAMAVQLEGPYLPIPKVSRMPIKARKVTDEEKKTSVFKTMRIARANARLVGLREKRAKDASEGGDPTKK